MEKWRIVERMQVFTEISSEGRYRETETWLRLAIAKGNINLQHSATEEMSACVFREFMTGLGVGQCVRFESVQRVLNKTRFRKDYCIEMQRGETVQMQVYVNYDRQRAQCAMHEFTQLTSVLYHTACFRLLCQLPLVVDCVHYILSFLKSPLS
jgi:L-ribulose-5-phosphate 3-epimerase UlaE